MSDLSITDRDATVSRLESIGRLTAGVAHDFNNLVTIVLGYADLLGNHLRDGTGRELLAGLEGAACQAARLAEHLLNLARQQPLSAATLDLSGLVQELAELFRRVFSKQITLVIEPAPGMRVRGIASELTQVILNVCLNARDAMPRGGCLTIRTEVAQTRDRRSVTREMAERLEIPYSIPSRWVQLRIADTGVGIPADVLPHIFEPFFTTHPGQGTGIGLATVRRIIEEHGGWIECESELGQGSCFDVYLPLWEDDKGSE